VFRERRLPKGVKAAAVLGALSPDVDCVLTPRWDVYLRAHEIGTHSLAGAMITGLASAAIVRAVLRKSSYRELAAIALLGAGSHLLADIAAGGRLRLFWPASSVVASLPLVAMGDPWTIAILIGGALALWRRQDGAQTARVTLLMMVVFLLGKAALLTVALARNPPDPARVAETSAVVDARWGSLTEWSVCDRTAVALRCRGIDVAGHTPVLLVSQPVHPEPPLVRSSRSLSTVRNFLAVHDLTFAVERPSPHGQVAVLWSDIRFCWPARTGLDSAECFVWFGGVFGADGRAVAEEVRVGSWTRTLPP
jgi:hypothetical protein